MHWFGSPLLWGRLTGNFRFGHVQGNDIGSTIGSSYTPDQVVVGDGMVAAKLEDTLSP